MDTVLWLCPSLPTETLKWLSSLPILMQESLWWWQCSDRYRISLFAPTSTPPPPSSPSLISLVVSVDVKHHVYFLLHILLQSVHVCCELTKSSFQTSELLIHPAVDVWCVQYSLHDLWEPPVHILHESHEVFVGAGVLLNVHALC